LGLGHLDVKTEEKRGCWAGRMAQAVSVPS
jgi:hypothetical protein